MARSVNAFKSQNKEKLYVSADGTGHKITAIDAFNGRIILDIAGASGLLKIHGFEGRSRVIGVHAIASAVGNANNVLQFYNLSAVSNSLSMFSLAVASANVRRNIRAIKRSNCVIKPGAILCVSGSGTAVSNLRATVIIETVPA